MRQKDYKNPIQFILGWPTTPGPTACPEVWLIYTLRLLEKTNYAFASQEVVTPIAFVPLWYQYNL